MLKPVAMSLAACLSAMILLAPSAAAQTWICPNGPGPGENQVGATGGSHGVALMPVCASDGSDPGGDEEGAGSSSAPYDPISAALDSAFALHQLVVANAAKVDALTNDPRFRRYHDGGWDHFKEQAAAKPGEFCAALWWRKESLLRVSGPGGDYRGAMLTFWSPDIPKPKAVERVKVTLSQPGDPPQTVEAFNYFTPGDEFGAIALAVPTIEAALGGMLEVNAFELAIKGKTVAKVEWSGGIAARDKLQACVKGR